MFKQLAGYLIVAFCWGGTNAFIKRGTEGLSAVTEKYSSRGRAVQLWHEFLYLACRWQYVLPLVLNLSGSSLYYYLLSDTDLSLTVPIVNALTFCTTYITGILLGETLGSRRETLGIFLVCSGVLINLL
ncbi:hypothetical protein HDV03_004608 [Kappamyces sp. JEL0829]|nr:hypothetical protein HDV03_004608 [Kappamyces sp. JEL0829]